MAGFLPMRGAQNVPLDDAAEQLAIQRRMKIADALRQQSSTELAPQMVGTQLVAPNPLQNIARAMAGWQANRADTDTMNMASQYADAKRAKIAQALAGLKDAGNPDSIMQVGAQLMGVPGGEQLGQQLYFKAADQARSARIMNQLFPAGQQPAQAAPAAPMSPTAQPLGSVDLSPQGAQSAPQGAPGTMSRQQLAAAYASGDPQAIRAATLLWGEQQRDQDRKEARDWRTQDMATQHDWHESDIANQQAFQKELMKLRQESANKPYFTYQPVTDASGKITGIAKLDARGSNPPELVNIPGMGPAVSTKDSGPVRGAVAQAQGYGKTTGEASAKREFNMAGLGDIINEADALMKGKAGPYGAPSDIPTESGLGVLYNAASALVGHTPSGAPEADRLKAIGGALVAKMPRMEGPQSDRDVQNYKEMAGEVGNASLPVARRQAALMEVSRLWKKYEKVGGATQTAPDHSDILNAADAIIGGNR